MDRDYLNHLKEQAKVDKETVVALTTLQKDMEKQVSICKEMLLEVKKTNGRVTSLEKDRDTLIDDFHRRQQLSSKVQWFWIERLFYIGLAIVIYLAGAGHIDI